MGQKVNPTGIRLGITEDWSSKWFVEKDYSKWLNQDIEARSSSQSNQVTTTRSQVDLRNGT